MARRTGRNIPTQLLAPNSEMFRLFKIYPHGLSRASRQSGIPNTQHHAHQGDDEKQHVVIGVVFHCIIPLYMRVSVHLETCSLDITAFCSSV